jgi:hypothetical protein
VHDGHAAWNWRRPSPLCVQVHPETDHPVANPTRERAMDSIIYLVGLIVVVMFILSALGLR